MPIALVLVTVFLGLAGCFPRPDLENRAEELGDMLTSMPGVETVHTQYHNGFSTGRVLQHRVIMEARSSSEDVKNATEALNQAVGDDFDDYRRELRFHQDSLTIDLKGEPDIAVLDQDLSRLDALTSRLSGGSLAWERNSINDNLNSLSVRGTATDGFAALSAIRATFGSEEMNVRYSGDRQQGWAIGFPYSAHAQQTLESAFRGASPNTRMLKIHENQVSFLSVWARDAPETASVLSRIIDEVRTVTPGEWRLQWMDTDGGSGSGTGQQSFGGSVSVGGCDYHANSSEETDPSQHFTPSAIAIRDQLRSKYDTCR